jgi:hypothetical protein
MWDIGYYDRDLKDESNALRCIMADEDKRQTYFENMSRAMALKCSDIALVMSAQKLSEVPKSGIWYNIEYKTLRKTKEENIEDHPWLGKKYNKQVNRINYLDKHGENEQKYWERGDSHPPKRDADPHATPALARREKTCGAPKGAAAAFDEGGALPVIW